MTFLTNQKTYRYKLRPARLLPPLIRAGLAGLLVFCLAGIAQAEDSQSIATRTEVPAEQWQAIRMRGLPDGASVEVQLESDGPLQAFIVSESQYGQLAEGGKALFASEFETRLQFRLRIPARGDYYLVLDNRRGESARRVSVGITGARD